MGRAERRRAQKCEQKAKTATYNLTRAQLDALVREKISGELDRVKQEATNDAINQAMILLLTLPLEVLMDHADAQGKGVLGGGDGHRLAIDVDLPLVGEVDAGEHVHQRGLAAAVLAQQGQDLALVQFKVYIFVCDDLAAEPLGDVLHSDRAFLFQGCHPFFRRRWLQHLEYAGDKFHTTYSTIHGERCKSKSAKNLSGIYKECEVTQERVILFV